jgi:Holliday junction resolvase RusA-like endonuclease
MEISIAGRFPGLNDMIDAAKKGKGKYQPYAIMKEQYTDIVAWTAKKLPKFNKIDIEITWYEPNASRDPDNIAAGGTKMIMDGLVKAGVIENDNRKHVNSISHKFETDRLNPRVIIEIREV